MKNLAWILVYIMLIFSFQKNVFAQPDKSDPEPDVEIIANSEPAEDVYGRLTDPRDGKTYKTIQIGDQTWMAENLNFRTKSGSWTYNNGPKVAMTYGRLYAWETALSVCPEGWRLPNDSDWDQLIQFLGGPGEAGGKMKEEGFRHWSSPNAGGNNQSGFTALPAGYRGNTGIFLDLGVLTFFWSSSEENQYYAWSRGIYVNYSGIYRNLSNKKFATSVRCIKIK